MNGLKPLLSKDFIYIKFEQEISKDCSCSPPHRGGEQMNMLIGNNLNEIKAGLEPLKSKNKMV